jgi:SAM-dependent methyltransferase
MTGKNIVRPIPSIRRVSLLRQRISFPGSARYWDRRYGLGGTSGDGSYGAMAAAKAEFLNNFVAGNGVNSVIEFGCGDGHQLSFADYPRYVGLDVSRVAIELCKRRFADDRTKSFFLYDGACFEDRAGLFRSNLSISLDVVYHLVEDNIFYTYMEHLFAAAGRYVVVYATNMELPRNAPHVRHRRFSSWIERNCPAWRLAEVVPGPNSGPAGADFFVYQH